MAWQAARQQPTGEPLPGALRGPPANARPDVMAPCYDALAACLTGDTAGAAEQIERALRAAEAAGQPYALAFAHSFHARLAVLQRDPKATRKAATRAIEIAAAHGFPLLIEHATIPMGWAHAMQGEPERGLAAIQDGLTALHISGQRILTPFHQALQAQVLLQLGDPGRALAVLDEAITEDSARGGGFEAAELHHLRGLALRELGRGDEALMSLRTALAIAQEQGAHLVEQRATDSLKRLAAAT